MNNIVKVVLILMIFITVCSKKKKNIEEKKQNVETSENNERKNKLDVRTLEFSDLKGDLKNKVIEFEKIQKSRTEIYDVEDGIVVCFNYLITLGVEKKIEAEIRNDILALRIIIEANSLGHKRKTIRMVKIKTKRRNIKKYNISYVEIDERWGVASVQMVDEKM